MKKTIKLIGIIALVAVIEFSFASCGDGGDDGGNNGGNTGSNTTQSLDGFWQSDDAVNRMVITIYGSNGLFTEIKSDSPWKSTSVKIGDQKFKNISKIGDLTWSSDNLVYNSGTYATSWSNTTITMNANGQTFTTKTPSTENITATYIRK
jgi:hypothetical protein